MTNLKSFSRAREFMLLVDDAVRDDGSENDFTEVSAGDDVKHSDSLLVSSKSADHFTVTRNGKISFRFL